MIQFFFQLTETPGVEQKINLMVSCVTPSPDGSGFKSANINYADLSPSEKATYNNFVTMVKSKCS